jgi:tetratricopeptide (TPR) repeat protein
LRLTVTVMVAAVVILVAASVGIYLATRPEPYRPGEDVDDITRTLSRELPADAPRPALIDVTDEAGLDGFVHFHGARTSQLPEDMGSGAAWGDYDNDGDEDLFIVAAGGALDADPARWAPSLLYENLGDGTFRPVADLPEIRVIGMGAAWGDYDGDGWQDLIVTTYGELLLFRNESGRLRRVQSFSDAEGYWAGAAWGDFERDGDLDLYVCGYVQYTATDADRARASQQYGRSVPYTLNPASYEPARNLLFRNEGDGTFTEVAASLGVDNPQGRSLGALWHDFDDDGWLDLYVANDISDNAFFRNLGGRFEDISHAAWVADYRGAMGLAAGDWNRDGDDDLFVTHWIAQENALYDSLLTNRRDPSAASADVVPALGFVDIASQRGLGQIALRVVGWGTEFADFDGDGWLDLVVSNGSTFETDDPSKWLQPQRSMFLWNQQGKHYHDLALLNDTLAEPRVGRGLALADYDRDGDLDLLIVAHGEGVVLLRNEMQDGHWLELRLGDRTGADGRARGYGEGAQLIGRIGDTVLRRAIGGPSYLSQSSRVVHFGLGPAGALKSLEVRWPDGTVAEHGRLEAGAIWEWIRGEPQPRRVASVGVDHAPAAQPRADDAATLTDREKLTLFWTKQRAAMDAMKRDGDLDRAIELFQQALKLDSDHQDSRYYLASCLARQNRTDEAIAQLRELTRIEPRSHRGHKQLGILLASQTQPDLAGAQAALERALEINREETGSLLALGEVAIMRGELEQAERRLSLVCQTNPRAAGGFYFLGYVALQQGDERQATEMLRRAREALGEEWAPEGTTSEGDVRHTMHRDETPLLRFFEGWDGSDDPATAFDSLRNHLETL